MIQLYARQILVIAVLLAIVGVYYYWKHTISEQGYSTCMAEVNKRDDYTMKQSERIRAEAKQQYDEERIKNETNYNNAISVYADYADRMRNTAKTNRASSNKARVPAQACDTIGIGGTSEEALSAIEEIKEFNLSVKACELIIEQFVIPNMEVR